MRIALIADSHLSERAPECTANWQAAARAVRAAQADLTVHLGDIAMDAPRCRADLHYAARLVRLWATRIRCVLGNHDMGTGSGEEPLSAQDLSRCIGAFGQD